MIPCDFIDFEETVEMAFGLGRTPFIIDTSPDEKVCTYYGYQPDVMVFDAQTMVAAWSTRYQAAQKPVVAANQETVVPVQDVDVYQVKLELLDSLRRSLVQAMKFGKLLVIRLGTSAPNFVGMFSDEAMDIDNTRRGTAYFPLIAFERGGYHMREPEPVVSSVSGKGDSSKKNAGTTAATASPGGHSVKKELTWAERLFREEDMRPHRNVAFCRDTFRVLLVSKLPLALVNEHIFGEPATDKAERNQSDGLGEKGPTGSGGSGSSSGSSGSSGDSSARSMLPDKELFALIVIDHGGAV